MRWLPSRAHDNGLFLLFSNGVGRDDDEIRTGNAMILDPYGRIVAETWAAEDRMVSAELDLTLIPLSTGRRWIYGRRPELYGLLTEPQGYERDARSARFFNAADGARRPITDKKIRPEADFYRCGKICRRFMPSGMNTLRSGSLRQRSRCQRQRYECGSARNRHPGQRSRLG